MATAATSTSDIVNEDLDLGLSQGLDSDAKNKELDDKDILILDKEDSICDLVESSYSAKFDVYIYYIYICIYTSRAYKEQKKIPI